MISSCCAANRANSMSRAVGGGRSSLKQTSPRVRHCSRRAGRTEAPENDGGAAVAPETASRGTDWRAVRQPNAQPTTRAMTARTKTDLAFAVAVERKLQEVMP